eukprot:CAMPEP_0114252500 /NCGR_PEP_ID=MMETSP0058-20121206/15870_1 /TAXON_ID=36894 /ORGANISM="Pyramimonas parkeae, CCMP726" /LENGTH=495 /DNA_ID=CAMNT_0001366439 /DNA_START=41 /DNA_END=1528 /DNA_ORIENTATION=+
MISSPDIQGRSMRMNGRHILTIYALTALIHIPEHSYAKRVEGELGLSSYVTEQYITKFSFSKGRVGQIHGNFSHLAGGASYFDRKPHDLRILLLDDDAWPKYYDGSFTKHGLGSLCVERIRMATWQQRITPGMRGGRAHAFGLTEASFTMTIPKENRKRTHFWYAVLADCYLEEYDAHPPEVHFDITFKNGETHLPADEMGLPTVYVLVLIGTSLFGVFVVNLLRVQYKQVGQVHLIVLLLGGAVLLQSVSHFCELMHLVTFMTNGKGLRWRHTVFALDFAAQVTVGLSELLVEFLLITLAFGWTLLSKEGGATGSGHVPIMGRLGMMLSSGSALTGRLGFVSVIAVAQVALEMLGRKYEDDFNQFHDFEHWPGFCLMGLRLLLCALFVIGGVSTMRCAQMSSLKVFMVKLLLLGVVWFLSMPLLVYFVSPFLEPYNRHPVVTGGTIVLQSVALGCISLLFLKNSSYLKMSTLAHMGTMFGSGTTVMKRFKVAVD